VSRYGSRQWAKWKKAGALSGALGWRVRKYDRLVVFVDGVRMLEEGEAERGDEPLRFEDIIGVGPKWVLP
jgi:hypothetical protein